MTKTYKQPEEVKIDNPTFHEPTFLTDSIGVFETVTAAPTGKPTNMINQIKFYSTGGVFRIYIYDVKNNAWKYATLS